MRRDQTEQKHEGLDIKKPDTPVLHMYVHVFRKRIFSHSIYDIFKLFITCTKFQFSMIYFNNFATLIKYESRIILSEKKF